MSDMSIQNSNRSLASAKPLGNTVPKFAINLLATAEGEFEVRSCEVLGNGYRNRTSFQRTARIEEVFVSAVASGLGDCLSRLSRKKEVMSLPELKIEAPGLALGCAHILVSEREEGQISVIVRFQIFLGNLDAVLCEGLRPLPSPPVLLDSLASEVLFDITLPILNICSAGDLEQLSNTEVLASYLEKLAENTDDLKFRSTLLRRFLEDISENRCARTPHLKPHTDEDARYTALNEVEPAYLDMKYD